MSDVLDSLYTDLDLLCSDTEYIINKSAYDCGVEGVKEEIVRCRDCEYFKDCRMTISSDGFCAWGKKKLAIKETSVIDDCKNIRSKEKTMKQNIIEIPLMYYYYGSSNIAIHLSINENDGLIKAVTDYGEVIGTFTSGHALWRAMRDLEEGKYDSNS